MYAIDKGLPSINSIIFNFKKRPYNLLLLTALCILVASFFALDQTFDIHLHDTYFIIAIAHLFWATGILLIILWILYILTRHFLFSKVWIWIHIILTVATSVFLVGLSFYSNDYYKGLAGKPRHYYEYGNWDSFLL